MRGFASEMHFGKSSVALGGSQKLYEVDRHQSFGGRLKGSKDVPLESSLRPRRNRAILLVGPPGTVSAAFIAAVECEFSFVEVLHTSSTSEAYTYGHRRVDLILIDEALLGEAAMLIAEMRTSYSGAPFAMIGDFSGHNDQQLRSLLEARSISGVLQQNANLEILLSSIRILLRGGDYVPLSLFTRLSSPAGSQHEIPSVIQQLSMLTPRETQILGKVATGSQNKVIAYDLGLSEHTIKVHLHKIITKLGVHNRTEAAAIYRDGLAGKEPAPRRT